jgi:stearoyl-CoA desaturase (Delta-9 desaturase)
LEAATAAEHKSGGTPPGSRIDRIANGSVTIVPLLLGAWAVQRAWSHSLHWQDVLIFFVMLMLTGFGITVGFHRLFTHRSFKTGPITRGVLAAFGSAGVEGPVIEWVAYHRRHHTFSDQEGDPHSPHAGHEDGWLGALKGLFHAHVGWVVFADEEPEEQRYARDLLADPVMRFMDKTFFVWVLAGLAIPFGLGVLLTGTITGGLTGLLWGGAVRILVMHHLTFCINSLCHFFGKQTYDTGDESRNLAWLAPFTFGEAWHNNHHAFPTSARHGLERYQLDLSMIVIWTLEKLGLAWDVVRVAPEKRVARALASPARTARG